jgi:collagen triple helix repeat protein
MTRGFLRFMRRNTIALLALFLALGGTTYAASTALIGKNTVASPQVVNGSLQTKDLSKKARAALKGNRGLRGFTGAQGAKGDTGAKGATGAQGVAGSALAYGKVSAAGVLDAANSKNINSVQALGSGFYCIDASVTVHNAVMTIGFGATVGTDPYIELEPGCNSVPANDVAVAIYNKTDTGTNAPFMFALN